MSDVVQKLWGFCHTLRHDGIDYGDYIEQITYLLFLKMADERAIDLAGSSAAGRHGDRLLLAGAGERAGTALTRHYDGVLRTLGRQPGMLGDIFAGAAVALQQPGRT